MSGVVDASGPLPERTVPGFVPHWPGLPEKAKNAIGFFVTTRGVTSDSADTDLYGFNLGDHVGDDPVAVSHRRAQLAHWVAAQPVFLSQVHGTAVLLDVRACLHTRDTPVADAAISTDPGCACTVMTADCLPVLFADETGQCVGAAHAGWRGLHAGVLETTVERMRERMSDPTARIHAWLGPAIGPMSFEVGAEVKRAFEQMNCPADAFKPSMREDHWMADIYVLARHRLARVGVVDVDGGVDERGCAFDTYTDERFFSHRRAQPTGRMASLVWIKPRG